MKIVRNIGFVLGTAVMLFWGGIARAEDSPQGPPPEHEMMMMHDHRPYGGYCQGPRWGWYGARTQIRTKAEAHQYLTTFFEGQDVSIGEIVQRGRFFVADILDKSNKVIDRVIVDRRTGRIRSIF